MLLYWFSGIISELWAAGALACPGDSPRFRKIFLRTVLFFPKSPFFRYTSIDTNYSPAFQENAKMYRNIIPADWINIPLPASWK
jgi:hypothetical protein